MKYTVKVKRKVLRDVEKMPKSEQEKLATLVDDLVESGPGLRVGGTKKER